MGKKRVEAGLAKANLVAVLSISFMRGALAWNVGQRNHLHAISRDVRASGRYRWICAHHVGDTVSGYVAHIIACGEGRRHVVGRGLPGRGRAKDGQSSQRLARTRWNGSMTTRADDGWVVMIIVARYLARLLNVRVRSAGGLAKEGSLGCSKTKRARILHAWQHVARRVPAAGRPALPTRWWCWRSTRRLYGFHQGAWREIGVNTGQCIPRYRTPANPAVLQRVALDVDVLRWRADAEMGLPAWRLSVSVQSLHLESRRAL